jgi:hypothetical protein
MRQFRKVPKYLTASETTKAGVATKVSQLSKFDYFDDVPDVRVADPKQIFSIDVETRSDQKVYRIKTATGTYYYDPSDIVYVFDADMYNDVSPVSDAATSRETFKSTTWSKRYSLGVPCMCYIIKGLSSYGRDNYLCRGNEWHEFCSPSMVLYLDRDSALNACRRISNSSLVECTLKEDYELITNMGYE